MGFSRLARIGLCGVLAAGSGVAVMDAAAVTAEKDTPVRGNIVGVVHDESGQGVAGVGIEVLDGEGQVLERATSSKAGGYEIRCLAEGTYDLRLDPARSGHRGQRVVAPVTGDGLRVDWTVAPDKPALARAHASGGSCSAPGESAGAPEGAAASDGSAAAVGLGAGALAISGTIGGLAASDAFDSDRDSPSSATPSQ